jgi:hypothetical protein
MFDGLLGEVAKDVAQDFGGGSGIQGAFAPKPFRELVGDVGRPLVRFFGAAFDEKVVAAGDPDVAVRAEILAEDEMAAAAAARPFLLDGHGAIVPRLGRVV